MKYFPSLITSVVTITGNFYGGIWVWTNTVLMLVVFVAMDWLIKPVRADNSNEDEFVPNLILILHVLMHSLAIITLLSGVYYGYLSGSSFYGAILSTGLNSGISGIISAHELIHRKQAIMQYLGIWNLFMVHYTHFFIEHIKNHHKNVGTTSDPATARKGESLYAFFVRTIPGQFRSALKIASEKKKWYTNYVVVFSLIQILIDILLYFYLGPLVLAAFFSQSIIAILLLEYVNYIEHYGLIREEGKKFDATHAWQSNAITSRITLLELSRHSDHHLKASKPYHTLVSHDTSPELPGGYFGVFYICLIPPLWFRMIDKIEFQ